jgi:hypothetical protein
MSHELSAHYVLDAGSHRHDDVDGFFTIATPSPAGDKADRYSLLAFHSLPVAHRL